MPYLLIAAGGALGAVTRYWVAVHWLTGSGFPWSTLAVNAAGSFCIGLLWGLAADSAWFLSWGRPFLLVGFLGGLTTFSTFSLETLRLVHDDRFLAAIGYVAATLILCLTAVALGYLLLRANGAN